MSQSGMTGFEQNVDKSCSRFLICWSYFDLVHITVLNVFGFHCSSGNGACTTKRSLMEFCPAVLCLKNVFSELSKQPIIKAACQFISDMSKDKVK